MKRIDPLVKIFVGCLLFWIVIFLLVGLAVNAAEPVLEPGVPDGYAKYGELGNEIYYDDLELLAIVVYAEAGNQDFKGKQLVADVVLNRMYDPRFPNTIQDVIYQKGQFYPRGSKRLAWAGCNVTDECFEAVKTEVEAKERLDNKVLFYSAGFYQPYGTPAYQYGAHCFNYWE